MKNVVFRGKPAVLRKNSGVSQINFNLYHYAGNNPVKYTDPDGNQVASVVTNPSFWGGLGVILGTIAEDIATFGAGLADDAPTIAIGVGLITTAVCAANLSKSNAISKAAEKTNNSKEYIYHVTGNVTFADNLKKSPRNSIDFSYSSPDSRFGAVFYAASDPITANMEATVPGITVKMEISKTANILDLTNPKIAAQYGYQKGMTRDDARYLMQSWNLTGVDAIKYESEKNPSGYNYAILNTAILIPAGE